MTRSAVAAMICLAASPAWAQVGGQSVTQPSANQNQSQLQSNQSGQAPNAAVSTGQAPGGQQQSQPTPNQNQPQQDTNQGQNPSRPPGATGGTTGTSGGR